MIEKIADLVANESASKVSISTTVDESLESNSFCWHNISVWIKQKEKVGLWHKTQFRDIQIVNRVSGFASQKSLVAVMGPSGSGKTTLLAAISHRLREGVHGNVYVNGRTISANQMLKLSGFVPQDDLTIQCLTVFEHLKIMAQLKMDRTVSDFHRVKKISIVMEDLGIHHLKSSYVSNLSGGEQRRLSIAVQMLSDPLLLFCDEPTTGLDSANAAVVVKLLKKFSTTGKIVICSIHQPAAAIYELFDQALLLAAGGRVAYFGSVQNVTNYFQKLNLICPSNYNIAEFVINNVSVSDFEAHERIKNLCECYSTSQIEHELQDRIKNISNDQHSLNKQDHMDPLSKYLNIKKPTLTTQTRVLLQRSFLSLRKDYMSLFLHVGCYLFIGTMTSLIFGPVTLCSENSVQNIRGAINSMVANTFFEFAYYQYDTLAGERHFIMREINNGLYSIEAYCIAKLLGKLMVSTIAPLVFVFIYQSFSNAYDHISFWNLAFPFIILAATSTAYGCMMSSLFNNLNVLFVVATGYEMPTYLLCGIAVQLNSLPLILSYLRYLSVFYYALEYISVMEWTEASDIQCPPQDSAPKGIDTNPQSVLQYLAESGYDVQHYKKDVWIIFSLGIIFFAITYRLLRYKSKLPVPY